jgi:tetratricopeptide (TPR) repeat protein
MSPHDLPEDGRMNGYAVARIDEIEEISDGRCPWRPVRFHFGITSFGVNAFTAHEVGDRLINEHDESQENDLQEELYLVQRGRATFELDGERVDAPAGTLVFAPLEVKRTAFAEEPGTTLVALGGTPGKAYQPQGGEIWMPLHHLYESGQYAEAADRGRETIEAHPEYPGPLYNLACCESLAGRTDDAIKHLQLAIDGNEPFRSLAVEDSDFDPIREEPAFKELVSGSAAQPATG